MFFSRPTCSCLPSFTPNTKCLLSDVLSMLTGFLPHGDVGRYYLFLRSRYRQFLGIWRIAMTKKEAASCQGVERGTIPENQQMKEEQNHLNFSYHCYADNTQLFLSFPPEDTTVSARISVCLADISTWMKNHHLQLNLGRPSVPFWPGSAEGGDFSSMWIYQRDSPKSAQRPWCPQEGKTETVEYHRHNSGRLVKVKQKKMYLL